MAHDATPPEKVKGAMVRGADGHVYFIPEGPEDPSLAPADTGKPGTPESAIQFRGPESLTEENWGPGKTLNPMVAGYYLVMRTPRS